MPRRLARTVLPEHFLTVNPFLPDDGGDGGAGGGGTGGQGGGANGDSGSTGGSGDGQGGSGSGSGDGNGAPHDDYKSIARRMEQRADNDRRLREAAEAEAAKAKKELEDARAATMSEQEKALKQARDEAANAARAEVSTKYAGRLVAAEARAALAGRGLDADRLSGLVEDARSLTRLIGADGEPDTEAITAWADRVAPAQQGHQIGGQQGGQQGGQNGHQNGGQNGQQQGGGRMPQLGQGNRQPAPGPTGAAAGAALYADRHKKKTTS